MTPPELERFAKLANWTNPPMNEAIEREKDKQAKKAKAASD